MRTSRYGKTALVTGASSGIGEAFVRRLVREGFEVIAVARRTDRLESIRNELIGVHGGSVVPIPLDLTEPHCGTTLRDRVRELGKEVDVLINNAGFGLLGEFDKMPLDRSVAMVDLNCRAVVEITHAFLPGMKDRRRGAVILVSSVVGAIPVPWFSLYGATKSFDLYLGEALHGEYRGTGVDILTVLPGLTRTEFHAGAGLRKHHSPYRSAEDVVETSLQALGRKAIVVDGWLNKIAVHGTRFLPRCILLPLSRAVMQWEKREA